MLRFLMLMLLWAACLSAGGAAPSFAEDHGAAIRPAQDNPWYWEYDGKPLVLLGGSDDDNLFQWPDLRTHLDVIAAAGGNYIRNTMSDRADKGFELYPFKRLESGKYDLTRFNDEYWQRFETMLRLAHERGIIVQIEVWDRFDYSDVRTPNWQKHPYHPRNNVNYTAKESGFEDTYKAHPGRNDQPFFYTVPVLNNNEVVLPYQVAQVDKLLSSALKYPNVLYCIDNETSGAEQWGRFWAEHIRERARSEGVEVHVTEMWDDWNPLGKHHKRTFDHPELYTFVDVSQNNHNRGEEHWRNLMAVRDYLSEHPRPINTVKIYGAEGGRFGNSRDGEERFWRNLIGGAAGTRFHRPDSGIGLSERARPHLRSGRLLLDAIDITKCQPDKKHTLLSDRADNEAFLTCQPGVQYAVYFPDGGRVRLDLRNASGSFDVRWLNVTASGWDEGEPTDGGKTVSLKTPAGGHWVCVVRRR